MRLAIIYDVEGWAIHSHAAGLQKYAPPGMDVDIRALDAATPDWVTRADVCYAMYLGGINFNHRAARMVSCVGSHAWQHQLYNPRDWRTRGVNKTRNFANGARILRKLDAAVCRNLEMARWARPLCPHVKVFPGGVDTDLWNPAGRREGHRKLRIGFCGQTSGKSDSDFKGHAEVFQPLSERLADRYDFSANTREHGQRLNQRDMAQWMRTLDVFICASCADCTPIPPFQAAACGAVVLSTRVGQLADWGMLDRLGLVVPDYGNEREAETVIEALAKRLRLLEDGGIRRGMQEQTLASIEREYSYRVLGPRTLKFVAGD